MMYIDEFLMNQFFIKKKHMHLINSYTLGMTEFEALIIFFILDWFKSLISFYQWLHQKKYFGKTWIDERNEISLLKITNIPQSICDEMATAAIKCISRAGGLVDGPVGSSLFYIANEKKPSQPYPVLYNVSKCNFFCYSDKCDRFKAFKICSHSYFSLKVLGRYIELVSRSCCKNLPSNIFNLSLRKMLVREK